MAAFAPSRPSTVERAFELSRLGAYATLPELVTILKRERHDAVDAHLAGPSIREDLRRLLKAAPAAAA
jgi:hypothetical protein